LLLTLPLVQHAWGKNVKPDPDGLPPQDVKDLHYGDVLFYSYQDDYFDSITRLLAARELQRLPNTQGEAELLLGGLYLSLGEHVEAGNIFEKLLNSNTSEAVRNKAWFYLGKVWYQRGYLQESERALRQVSDKIQPRISAERYMLLAQLMLREQRYDDAIAALNAWHGPPDWTAYAQFNLGVALVRTGRRSTRSGEWIPRARSCWLSETKPTSPWDSRFCRPNVPPTRDRFCSGCVWTVLIPARRCWGSVGPIRRLGNSSEPWCRGLRCASAICWIRPFKSRT
jgi:predicted negative regulator of RcsB-dependent stress response